MTYLKLIFQVLILIFLLNNQLFSQDNRLEFLPENSFIYISSDSIKNLYFNYLAEHPVYGTSDFDERGNLVDFNGNVYFVREGDMTAEEAVRGKRRYLYKKYS